MSRYTRACDAFVPRTRRGLPIEAAEAYECLNEHFPNDGEPAPRASDSPEPPDVAEVERPSQEAVNDEGLSAPLRSPDTIAGPSLPMTKLILCARAARQSLESKANILLVRVLEEEKKRPIKRPLARQKPVHARAYQDPLQPSCHSCPSRLIRRRFTFFTRAQSSKASSDGGLPIAREERDDMPAVSSAKSQKRVWSCTYKCP